MRFTIQYIPLSKIKPDTPANITSHIRELRNRMWDCMQVLVVRKNRRDGTYVLLLGHDRYEFLRKHTKKLSAPCLIDESKPKAQGMAWLDRFRGKRLPEPKPHIQSARLTPVTWSILRSFLKEEPRMKQLTRLQQLQVLILAVRYKKTVLASMKMKVDQLSTR